MASCEIVHFSVSNSNGVYKEWGVARIEGRLVTFWNVLNREYRFKNWNKRDFVGVGKAVEKQKEKGYIFVNPYEVTTVADLRDMLVAGYFSAQKRGVTRRIGRSK